MWHRTKNSIISKHCKLHFNWIQFEKAEEAIILKHRCKCLIGSIKVWNAIWCCIVAHVDKFHRLVSTCYHICEFSAISLKLLKLSSMPLKVKTTSIVIVLCNNSCLYLINEISTVLNRIVMNARPILRRPPRIELKNICVTPITYRVMNSVRCSKWLKDKRR